jgi:hypothetical protein
MLTERKRLVAVLLVCLLALTLIWLLRPQLPAPSNTDASVSTASSESSYNTNTLAKDLAYEASDDRRPRQTSGHDRVQSLVADPKSDWKTPIEFYGKVVDERDDPVPGAIVSLLWTDLSPNGSSQVIKETDVQGMFGLKGVRGKTLVVQISEGNYYTSLKSNQFAFEYSDPVDKAYHEPNSSRPVVFHLRRKGVAAGLISQYVKVPLLKNGTPVWFDFVTAKASDSGQLEVRSWKPEKDPLIGFSDWRVRLSIESGGLAEITEEFPFLAPESGYSNRVVILRVKSSHRFAGQNHPPRGG